METINDELDDERIAWHPAFVEALQLELEAYQDSLEFFPEYQLTAEPLRIDCVVIKKTTDAVINKNIAAIFRQANLLEYKSPDDYVSVDDFYKVYGYACLYASFQKIPITSLTVSFIESRHPRQLLNHLREIRGYTLAEKWPGVYIVSGDILPIQIIDSRRLSAEENIWLKGLDNRLNAPEIQRVTAALHRKGKAARIQAYLDAIIRANKERFEEAINMSGTALTLEQIFERTGLLARWEARGEERQTFAIAQNMVKLGFPFEAIVSATELDPEAVKTLYQTNV
ncbi:MAG: hypothetical protein LBB89_12075 [Treponema sp.]|jgi:hypothetical protein|nr:hypothetical protein [Treponema sp.]